MNEQHNLDVSKNVQITGGLFNNSENINIYGGNFTSIINAQAKEDGFRILQDHVASAAFHNSKQRVDPPRCHKNTREAILEDLFDWIVSNIPRETWVAWLNGAAGAGKSAICQSIAEICIQRGVKVASFFFFRNDNSRSVIDPLVATLAYQIIQILPEVREDIVRTVETHPLIFDQNFETQFDLLIVQPIRRLQGLANVSTLLVIIDGVDECSGDEIQMNMIQTIAELLRSKDLPLVVLFASRCENQIQMAFDSEYMDDVLKRLPLDDDYRSSEDIQLFLDDKLNDIKRSHPFRKSISNGWPPEEHVKEIVVKSSGQFVYASVVVKFLSMPSYHPSKQLDIIRGLHPAGRVTPFAQLDALYQHILSRVEDLQLVLNLLAYHIFSNTISLPVISHFFDLSLADTQTALAPLVSLVDISFSGNMFPKCLIYFRHASFPDFLKDGTRSKEYCINTFGTNLAVKWFEKAATGGFFDGPYAHYYNSDIDRLLRYSKPTSELRTHIMKFSPSSAIEAREFPRRYLTAIRKLDFADEGETYRHSLVVIARFAQENFPNSIENIAQEHDISAILEGREKVYKPDPSGTNYATSNDLESQQTEPRQPDGGQSTSTQPPLNEAKEPRAKGKNKRRRGRRS